MRLKGYDMWRFNGFDLVESCPECESEDPEHVEQATTDCPCCAEYLCDAHVEIHAEILGREINCQTAC